MTFSDDGTSLILADGSNFRLREVTYPAPTSAPTGAPTNSPTSEPSNAPTSSPTVAPTNSPTSEPTSAPTSAPTTSAPTSAPTAKFADHIYVHAADIHGDGWGNDLVIAVTHNNAGNDPERRLTETFEPEFYSLNCACKVIRIASATGDMTISMHRNTTEHGPRGEHVPYEWEALWTVGYSDGLSVNPLGVYGGVNTEVVIEDWNVVSSSGALDINVDAPKNRCVPPPPPKPAPGSAVTDGDDSTNSTTTSSSDGAGKPPVANVRLVLAESEGSAWCDDSGATHESACSKENVNTSPDATLPNLLTYPRYFISDAEGRVLLEQGTMRVGVVEDVREVKLPREGSFVFSVSGHYLSEGGSLSWDFCGEQGGIGERLHFDMEHGVCKSHYIEELNDDLTCDGEWNTNSLSSAPIKPLSASSQLSGARFGMQVGTLVVAGVAMVAMVLMLLAKGRTKAKDTKFARLDTTEHA
jgi:hypothetical protein